MKSYIIISLLFLSACNGVGTCSSHHDRLWAIISCKYESGWDDAIDYNVACEKKRESGSKCQYKNEPKISAIFECEEKKLNYSYFNCEDCIVSFYHHGIFCK